MDKQMIDNLFACIYEENVEGLNVYDYNDKNTWDMKMPEYLMAKYDYNVTGNSITPLGFAIYCYATEYRNGGVVIYPEFVEKGALAYDSVCTDRPGLLKMIEYIIKYTTFTVDLQNELDHTMSQEIDLHIDVIHNYCLHYSECYKNKTTNNKLLYNRGRDVELDEIYKNYSAFMGHHRQKIINLRYIKKLLKQKKIIPRHILIETVANIINNIRYTINSIFTPSYNREEI